jgi:drug/metabolite transporter (DMT)-like permease
MLLAWLILAEIPTVTMVAGAILALAGVVIVNVFGRTAS